MKKKFLFLAFSFILLAGFFNAKAATVKDDMKVKIESMTAEQKTARAEAIKERVMEIKAMDKSQLSSAEKKALRKELRSLSYEAKALGSGGVYISLAGIVIIILILILIL